jgi:hypothetical protein
MRTTKAEDREKRIAHCVALIADIRRARSWQDFERQSDAELIEGLADRLTANPNEHRLIACALALRFDIGRDIEPVRELLDDLGISDVDPQNHMVARHSAVNKHNKRASEVLRDQCVANCTTSTPTFSLTYSWRCPRIAG